MALTAKQKRVKERLEQIKSTAVSYALNPKQADAKAAANLAEEAAGLALELLEEVK
jgi:hypothetical protein